MASINHFFQVKIVCESRDLDHTRHLKKVLIERYDSVNFGDFPHTLDKNTSALKNISKSECYETLRE